MASLSSKASVPNGFVVIWNTRDQNVVSGQMFDATGRWVNKGEFQVSAGTNVINWSPINVAALTNGGFVACYVTDIGAFENAVCVRAFDANGAGAVDANGNAADVQTNDGVNSVDSPTVSGLANGGFVVTWTDGDAIDALIFDASGQPATKKDAKGNPMKDAKGNPIKDIIPVATPPLGSGGNRCASVAGLRGGGFVVTWESYEPFTIKGQKFGASGIPDGTEFVVNTTIENGAQRPLVAALAREEGGFVVVWMSTETGVKVRGRLFHCLRHLACHSRRVLRDQGR